MTKKNKQMKIQRMASRLIFNALNKNQIKQKEEVVKRIQTTVYTTRIQAYVLKKLIAGKKSVNMMEYFKAWKTKSRTSDISA